jgi:hypothetical protein
MGGATRASVRWLHSQFMISRWPIDRPLSDRSLHRCRNWQQTSPTRLCRASGAEDYGIAGIAGRSSQTCH